MTASPFIDEILLRARKGMGSTQLQSGRKPQAERLWRGMQSGGSVMVKRIAGAGVQHPKQLAGQLAYINGEDKARGTFGFASGVTAGGEAFDKGDLAQMIDAWAADWKGRPRNGHTSHMVLSFPDNVSPAAAKLISEEWCREMFEDREHADDSWEYVAVLHTDKDHPHVHVVLNNRGVEGSWFSISMEGVFNPQMMRDRMSDIGDDYGVYLESMTRADKGLYHDPISSAEIHAAREGRTLVSHDRSETRKYLQIQDMMQTAQMFASLGDLAEAIGAPIIANKAYLASSALFAGKEIPKGDPMDLNIDPNANRDDIRSSIIAWTEQNAEQIEAMPEPDRVELMQKINTALELIETDRVSDITEETTWGGLTQKPSDYLLPDKDAIESRAALYVDDANRAALDEFVETDAMETYLVTGEVDERLKGALPALEDAYREMHSHELSEIPKEMKEYMRAGENLGLDRDQIVSELVNPVTSVADNIAAERDAISTIYQARNGEKLLEERFEQSLKAVNEAAEASLNTGITSEDTEFENLAVALGKTKQVVSEAERSEAWREVSAELIRMTDASEKGELTERQNELLAGLAPSLYAENRDEMQKATEYMARREASLAETDADILQTGKTPDEVFKQLQSEAREQNAALDDKVGSRVRSDWGLRPGAERAAQEYEDWQMALGDVEGRIIENSTVYSREGLSRVLQDAATTAQTTGRADFANPGVAQSALRAFAALEGRDAMAEISEGNLSSLDSYVDTPAQQKLVAKELLNSARTVDVGLEQDEIDRGLDAVDPVGRSRGGISI